MPFKILHHNTIFHTLHFFYNSWATFPEGGACSAEELPLAGGRILVKSAASMGGHNVVLSLAVDG